MTEEMKEAMLIFCLAVESEHFILETWVRNNYLNFCRILNRKPKEDL